MVITAVMDAMEDRDTAVADMPNVSIQTCVLRQTGKQVCKGAFGQGFKNGVFSKCPGRQCEKRSLLHVAVAWCMEEDSCLRMVVVTLP